MLDRVFILVAVAVTVAACVALLRAGAAVRRQRAAGLSLPPGLMPRQRPLLLAFSTPRCAECRYRQTPAIEEIKTLLGPLVEIRLVDATREPDLAAHFGILTAPSTVIAAPPGRVVARNDGFAPVETLLAQLRPLVQSTAFARDR